MALSTIKTTEHRARLRTIHADTIRKIDLLGTDLLDCLALAVEEPLSLGGRAKYDTEARGQAVRLGTAVQYAAWLEQKAQEIGILDLALTNRTLADLATGCNASARRVA